ncbi:hypothetical protein ACHAPJ_005173 [Fusarium lateritium]
MSSFTPINGRPDKMSNDGSSTIASENSSSDDNKNNNNNNSESKTNTHTGQVRPWQRKALKSGRTPLPESPGDRPWLNQAPSNPQPPSASSQPRQPSTAFTPFASSFSGTRSFSSTLGPGNHSSASGTNAGQASSSNTDVPQTYRFWTEEEMRRLITIRNGGAGWPDIFAAFPHRTPEAIKQTYHKRRYAIERQMQQEAAATAPASSSNKDDEMINDEPKDNGEDDKI